MGETRDDLTTGEQRLEFMHSKGLYKGVANYEDMPAAVKSVFDQEYNSLRNGEAPGYTPDINAPAGEKEPTEASATPSVDEKPVAESSGEVEHGSHKQ